MKKLIAALLSAAALTSFAAPALADCCKDKECVNKTEKHKECVSASGKASKDPTEQDVVIDPVCGMDVKVSESEYSYQYKGKTYHFCNQGCMKAFKKAPSKYIKESK